MFPSHDPSGEIMVPVRLSTGTVVKSTWDAPMEIGSFLQRGVEYARTAQLLILPVERVNISEVDNLSYTARGDGGFGSTGTAEVQGDQRD